MLFDTIAVAFDRVVERPGGDPEAGFIEHQPRPDFDNRQRVIGPGTAEAQRGFHERFKPFRSVQRQRQRITLHRAAAQQAGETEEMIAM